MFAERAQYHVTHAYGVPQNNTWQFFDSELFIHYMGYDVD